MSVARSVADILTQHVTLELEGIDRMYLNVIVRGLQYVGGVVGFLRKHRGHPIASTAMVAPMSTAFVKAIEKFAVDQGVPLLTFEKGQRKDDVAKEHLARFTREEGVLFVGKAQEKVRTYRTEKRRDEKGLTYPWLVTSTAMVNQFYFYAVDRDVGPFFLKFSSYFPYNAKLCINGHEYLKRQLARRSIPFEALDNGLLSCAEPARAQQLADGFSAEKIDALLRKWLRRLPHPFLPKDRAAGYRYSVFMLQSEFSLTQVLDRPLAGRLFFEQVIRENLDLGRPDHVQLIFNRAISSRTPGRFRTRVITDDVIPSLHVDYKHSRIKQYFKEGRALRTETTVNANDDFGLGRALHNLPALREVGFTANRRLLDVQRISHDCFIGDAAFERMNSSCELGGQRAAALRFGDRRAQTLLHALLPFSLLPRGFSNRDLRESLAPLHGVTPDDLSPGRMTYDLRNLRLHGVIERIPKTHRYRLTDLGLRIALFFTRAFQRVIRPNLSLLLDDVAPADTPIRKALDRFDAQIARCCAEEHLAA
jgi:hypothetical protein